MNLYTTLRLAGSVLAATTLASTSAMAFTAYATAHLHIRSGPGEQFPIVGEMRWNSHGQVDVCTPDYQWCHIATRNGIGWAAAYYLIENTAQGTETIDQFGARSGIPVMGAEVVTMVGAVTPVPVGGALVEAVTPETYVIEYIRATPVAAVYVNGEIIVGAVLPEEVVLYEVPRSTHQYAVINGATVLVEPATRRIVYIV